MTHLKGEPGSLAALPREPRARGTPEAPCLPNTAGGALCRDTECAGARLSPCTSRTGTRASMGTQEVGPRSPSSLTALQDHVWAMPGLGHLSTAHHLTRPTPQSVSPRTRPASQVVVISSLKTQTLAAAVSSPTMAVCRGCQTPPMYKCCDSTVITRTQCFTVLILHGPP